MKDIKKLFNIPQFRESIEKLYLDDELDSVDVEYLLTCAMILLKKYDETGERHLFELAYNIVLRYSIQSENYEPLYDVSCNYGFYPTVNFIDRHDLLNKIGINNILLEYQFEKFKNDGYVETYEQNKTRKNIIKSKQKNIAFIAPTSSGKSSIISQHLNKNSHIKKAVVIVPSRALIAQTYIDLRHSIQDRKIINHDTMYKGEDRLVGVLTQERLLRLLEKNNDIKIDCLYIDEAHNIFNNDGRNILLARAIKACKLRNPELQSIYLSPFVNDANNFKINENYEVDEQRITFNIKEPKIFIYNKFGEIKTYNRFYDQFYNIETSDSISIEKVFSYIKKNCGEKNFLFAYSPRKIELLAKMLYENTSEIDLDDEVKSLQELLRETVHPDFRIIEYLSHGIIYLHAKIPEHIKEYLKYQFQKNNSIKYLVANSVIMEGINLPIDALFICNEHQMKPSEIQNLMGRVNRLNTIFGQNKNSLSKLCPNIHFLYVPECTTKNAVMENLVRKAFRNDDDVVHNPLLDNCSIEDLSDKSRNKENAKNQKIIQEDQLYFNCNLSEIDQLRKQLLISGINEFFDLTAENASTVKSNIENCDFGKELIEIVSFIFTNNLEIKSDSFWRLKNKDAIRFYKGFMQELRKGDFYELIDNQLKYHIKRAKYEEKPYLYVGDKFGELPGEVVGAKTINKVYVDIRSKTHEELVNLMIIKTKIEQDFLGFQYNKALNFLHDNNYITDERYNAEVYGSTDKKIIELQNLGLSTTIVSLLKRNDLLEHLHLNQYGNLLGDQYLQEFYIKQNGLIRYEMGKYIIFKQE